MIRNRPIRRTAEGLLMALGGALLLLAPSVHYGLVAFALGIALELGGLALERRGSG